MKKYFIVLAFSMFAGLSLAQEATEDTLAMAYNAPASADSSIGFGGVALYDKGHEVSKQATIGGISGTIMPFTMADGTIYYLLYLPSNDGDFVSSLDTNDIETLKTRLETEFDIQLDKVQEGKPTDYTYETVKNGVVYTLKVKADRNDKTVYKISINIYDQQLMLDNSRKLRG